MFKYGYEIKINEFFYRVTVHTTTNVLLIKIVDLNNFKFVD